MRAAYLLAGLMLVPLVAAEQATYQVDDTGSSGVELRGTMDYPGRKIPIGHLFEVVIDAAQQGSTPTSTTITAPTVTGCAIVATTPTTAGNDVATLRVQLQMTNRTCTWHGTVTAVGTSGVTSNTVHFAYSGAVVAPTTADDVLRQVARFAFLFWLAYFVGTRFIRGDYAVYFRIAADVVAFGLLALPIQADQFELLATVLVLALVIDLFVVLKRPTGDI